MKGALFSSDAELELTERLDERHRLDVTDRSAELRCQRQAGKGLTHLDDADIGLLARLVDRYPRHTLKPVLDRVRDVRDDLDRLAKVVASSLDRVSRARGFAGAPPSR